ncbi:metallophosphoesterase [Oceanimonas smirnovii]|uniref:metallophosphoesterase n=1 Tax=Oceanimonas smirnovii TaxID=264574 RepID=UPI0003602834|nr:metallophosphoesterase [Oceanimonas smirnovii]
MYDLIGDIHGHAAALESLLVTMGYQQSSNGWCHPERKVIFLGDFIDRGPEQCKTVEIARNMVENGQALAVMGNHEFNAVAYATPEPDNPEQYLRPHTVKNYEQHQAYLSQVGEGSDLHREHIAWFKNLPLYLDLPEFRVVHACWHPAQIRNIKPYLDDKQRILEASWPELTRQGSSGFDALETLLKGLEIILPQGHQFFDKDRNPRCHIRTEWWNLEALTYRELAMVPSDAIPQIPDTPVPTDMLPGYDGHKPVFVGHYWLTGEPTPLNEHIACLDFSIAAKSDGKLCAYRWDGQPRLTAKQFCWVPYRAE